MSLYAKNIYATRHSSKNFPTKDYKPFTQGHVQRATKWYLSPPLQKLVLVPSQDIRTLEFEKYWSRRCQLILIHYVVPEFVGQSCEKEYEIDTVCLRRHHFKGISSLSFLNFSTKAL